MKKFFHKLHFLLTENKAIASVVIIIMLVASFMGINQFFLNPSKASPKQTIEVENSPRAIATIGQIGDIYSFVNQRPTRHLGEAEKIEINKFLAKKSKEVQVWYLSSDAEAKSYATQLKNYLESEDYNVKPSLTSFHFFDPIVGVEVDETEDIIVFFVGTAP